MSSHGSAGKWRVSARLEAVQRPIIPIVAGWTREHPGTISLGQGVVWYGPPPESFQAVEEFGADPENHKYKPVQGLPALVEAITGKLQSENRIPAEPQWEPVLR